MKFVLIAIAVLVLMSYAVGRWLGRREGRFLGAAQAPLQLRLRALDDGVCPLCGANAQHGTMDMKG